MNFKLTLLVGVSTYFDRIASKHGKTRVLCLCLTGIFNLYPTVILQDVKFHTRRILQAILRQPAGKLVISISEPIFSRLQAFELERNIGYKMWQLELWLMLKHPYCLAFSSKCLSKSSKSFCFFLSGLRSESSLK